MDTNDMTHEPTHGLTPRLRFPEFADAGEWEETKLGEAITLEYGSPLSEQNRNDGIYPVIGSNGIVGYHDQYIVHGPAIVIGRKGSAGQVNWVNADCYPIDTTFYVKNKHDDCYLLPFLRLILEKINLERLKDNGAVPGINRNEVYQIKAPFPKPQEQQRIADCLTSLDDLIAAHSAKLDALKVHKKGLMQQLFPAEGETVPRLRFPEFADAGEWEGNSLQDICNRVIDRVGDALLTPVSITAGYGFVSQASKFGRDISGAQYKNYIFLRRGDFAYNRGNSKRHPQGYVCQLKEFDQAAASTAFLCFRLKDGYEANFIQGLFDTNIHGKQLAKHITSSARSDGLLNINPEVFFSIILPIPSQEEQQRIADCLTSLDDLIAAHSAKLDALRAHKKGLMQQLFPSTDEVQG